MPSSFVIPAGAADRCAARAVGMAGVRPRHEHHLVVSQAVAVWSYIYATSYRRAVAARPVVRAACADGDQHLARRAHAARCVQVVASARQSSTVAGALRLARRCTVDVASARCGWPCRDGHRRAETIVDLAFPLRSGHYYIANGGSTELVNAHLQLLTGERFRRYRGASYGIDILALDTLGNRASGFAPRDPAQYAIFGDAIYAPCEGVVVRVEDWLPDLAPPDGRPRAHGRQFRDARVRRCR